MNGVMLQYFEWYLENDGNHWKRLKEDAKNLKEKGITSVWIPPCYKSYHQGDVGYGVYDLFDLGEFNQKGSIRTKYGTKNELLVAIEALHQHDIEVYADVVINQKGGADELEEFTAVKVDPENRHKEISKPHKIEGWTAFHFPGRKNTYSDFKWNWRHFTGVDWDEKSGQEGIFRIEGENKGWADDHLVDTENGNYDYLVYADIDYRQEEVRRHIKEWIVWFIRETNVDGFRLDALKHIDFTFITELVEEIQEEMGDDGFLVGEYWSGDIQTLENYLKEQKYKMTLKDVPLHFAFHQASVLEEKFDLRNIFTDTLLGNKSEYAVTFVDNHDTQPGQSLESWVEKWFKPLAYGMILLNQYGYPCVFYGDYHGINGPKPEEGLSDLIDQLLEVRQRYAHGPQEEYLDHPNCIGFIRRGTDKFPEGCAVIFSNAEEQTKKMFVGKEKSGKVYIDYLNHRKDELTIDQSGYAEFRVNARSLSVWVEKESIE